MINLIPTDINTNVSFARRNRTLVRWVIAMLVGMLGIMLVLGAGYIYINYQVDAYSKQVKNSREQLAKQELEATQSRVQEISNSVKLANDVLSKEILFSKLLQGIGSTIPQGAALQDLNITNDLDGGIDLTFAAVDYQTGTQVQVNLTDSENKIFEKADIQNISCSAESSSDDEAVDSEYPCQITIRALFAKDSPYTFTRNEKEQN